MELISFTVLLLLTAAFLYGTVKSIISLKEKKVRNVKVTTLDVFKLVLMILCTGLTGGSFIQML